MSRGTLSLRFKVTPATRSISAMSCLACSAARWRGVCCLWKRNRGTGERKGMEKWPVLNAGTGPRWVHSRLGLNNVSLRSYEEE